MKTPMETSSLVPTGPYQILPHRRFREHTDYEWQDGAGDLAGHLVSGV